MSQALESLKELISKSDLSPEDKNDLLVFLPIFEDQVIERLNNLFQEHPEEIANFNGNFKTKIKALTGKSDEEWDEIIRKEAEEAGELPIEEEIEEEEEVPEPDELEPEE
jgi:Skp family chaperone for outer membrane proteins